MCGVVTEHKKMLKLIVMFQWPYFKSQQPVVFEQFHILNNLASNAFKRSELALYHKVSMSSVKAFNNFFLSTIML